MKYWEYFFFVLFSFVWLYYFVDYLFKWYVQFSLFNFEQLNFASPRINCAHENGPSIFVGCGFCGLENLKSKLRTLCSKSIWHCAFSTLPNRLWIVTVSALGPPEEETIYHSPCNVQSNIFMKIHRKFTNITEILWWAKRFFWF